MKQYLKLFSIFLILFCAIDVSYAFDFKKLNPFKKKTPPPKIKMVETKEEWDNQAKNIPLEERKLEKYKEPVTTKKFYYPKSNYIFETYNYPSGKRDVNIEEIKKNLQSFPYFVADSEVNYIAYPRYYFFPASNQITSEFFVEKLDVSKGKKERIIDYNHNQKERTPKIKAGTLEVYPNLYRGLNLVDWSKDGKKLLIKEKVGSLNRGIYKTYLYVHFLENEVESGKTIKLLGLDDAIKNYFLDYQKMQLVKYRYDIEPLGFASENDNIIVLTLFVLDNSNKRIFLGTFGYDVVQNQTFLVSKTNASFLISANGIILKQTYE